MSSIVTFEQASRLKEIGFGLKWTAFLYEIATKDIHNAYAPLIQCQPSSLFIKAPTVSEALDYLREESNLMMGVDLDSQWRQYKWWHEVEKDYIVSHVFTERSVNGYDEYRLCESALLTAVLDYLEKKGGEG